MVKKLTAAQVDEVCLRYLKGESSKVLAQEMLVSSVAIRGLLKRRNIERRTPSESARIYQFNQSFFHIINNEEKAYWLGFLGANANIEDEGCISLKLGIQDLNHLQAFKDTISSMHPLKLYETKGNTYCSLSVYSKQTCADLRKIGIVPRKTFVLQFPLEIIGSDLSRHFLRGYVDGDGGFYLTKTNRKSPNHLFSLTFNEIFLQQCQTFLCNNLGLNQTKIGRRNKDSPIGTLRYCGRKQVKKIAEWLYNDASIYLARKRNKILSLLD